MGAFRRTNSVTLKRRRFSGRNEDVGVSKNRGTPKWMVKIMGNPIKMDDLGVPIFLETPMCQKRKGSHNQNGCPKMNHFPLDLLGIPIMSKHIS